PLRVRGARQRGESNGDGGDMEVRKGSRVSSLPVGCGEKRCHPKTGTIHSRAAVAWNLVHQEGGCGRSKPKSQGTWQIRSSKGFRLQRIHWDQGQRPAYDDKDGAASHHEGLGPS